MTAPTGFGLPDLVVKTHEAAVSDWQIERNERGVGVDWQFTTKDAHIRLKRLYPSVQS